MGSGGISKGDAVGKKGAESFGWIGNGNADGAGNGLHGGEGRSGKTRVVGWIERAGWRLQVLYSTICMYTFCVARIVEGE